MKVSLCYLFNAVFDSQDIPQDWQNGLIVPLSKDVDRKVATNYRGITLLSIRLDHGEETLQVVRGQ